MIDIHRLPSGQVGDMEPLSQRIGVSRDRIADSAPLVPKGQGLSPAKSVLGHIELHAHTSFHQHKNGEKVPLGFQRHLLVSQY